MDLVLVLILLFIVASVLYVVNALLRLPPVVKTIINLVAALLLVLFLLEAFGVNTPLHIG